MPEANVHLLEAPVMMADGVALTSWMRLEILPQARCRHLPIGQRSREKLDGT